MYGGGADAKTSSYMLQYRKCGLPSVSISHAQIPDYLMAEIHLETQALIEEQQAYLEKLLIIQVKVYEPQGIEFCHVSIHKTQTIAELTQLSGEHLKISDKFRLRHFDPRLKVMLEEYDAEKSLVDNGIHGFNIFVAEKEPFQQFEPDCVHVRVVVWPSAADADATYSLQDLDNLPFSILKVNPKTQSVRELETQISCLTGIEADSLLILLRHEPLSLNQTPRVEILNMDWARQKLLKDLRTRFDHGHMLFVESGSMANFQNLKWYKAIMGDSEMLKLHVGLKGFSIDQLTIKINKNKTLKELKIKIGEVLDITAEDFTLKRKFVVKELKELSLKLVELGLTDGAMLEATRGSQHVEGFYDLKVNFARILKEEAPLSEDEHITQLIKEEKLFAKKQLGCIKVDSNITLGQFKQ